MQPFPDFITALTTASTAKFSHRPTRTSPWEPYPPAQNDDIFRAIRSQPSGGKLAFGNSSFELRWGSEARSGKMSSSQSGMMQVNTKTENTREVKGECDGGSLSEPQRYTEPVTAYAHQEPRTKEWVPYAADQNALIDAAIKGSPGGGSVKIAHNLPFEVRWGNDARGGMIQMNVNTHFVRQVQAMGGGNGVPPPLGSAPPMGVQLGSAVTMGSSVPIGSSVPMGIPLSPGGGATGPPMGQPMGPPMGAPPPMGTAGGTPMTVKVPPGMAGGQTIAVQTPKGVMNVDIPHGLVVGQEFQFLLY